MEEREFFDERPEKKMATLNCPHCHQPAEYEVTWIVRTKKRQLSGRADERDSRHVARAGQEDRGLPERALRDAQRRRQSGKTADDNAEQRAPKPVGEGVDIHDAQIGLTEFG